MIVSNLPVLMAKTRIFKITDVSARTGISRTTIHSLYHGKAKGVQFDTLDTLCKLFGVGVDELIVFVSEEDKQKSPSATWPEQG